MRVLRRSQAVIERKYGEGTIAHVSPKGVIELGPGATEEDLEHEKAHSQIGFTRKLDESGFYKRYVREEIGAWLRVKSNRGKLNTDFVWRVASNALDYKGATPIKVLREVSKSLKGTEYELNKREKKWLLKMLKAVGE